MIYFARADLGLRQSRDGGATWTATGYPGGGAEAVALAAGPGELVAVATAGADVLRSRDGGRTWQAVLERGRPVRR